METKTQVLILIIIAALAIAIVATSRTSLLTVIDVDLSGIMPEWEQYWENFVAVQINSSVKEISVNLTFGKYKSEVCEKAVYLTNGDQSLDYNISDESYDEENFCTSTIVKWENKIYDSILLKKPRMIVYFLYFGPIKPMPSIIPVIQSDGETVNIEPNETLEPIENITIIKPYLVDARYNNISTNISFAHEGETVWTSDSEQQMPTGIYDIKIIASDITIELVNTDVLPETTTLLYFDKPPVEAYSIENLSFVKLFAIEPLTNFSYGNITTISVGDTLWKCQNWNFSNRSCDENWILIQNLTNYVEYTVDISVPAPAWGETIMTFQNITNDTLTEDLILTNETINTIGIVKTKITSSNLTFSDKTDDTLYLFVDTVDNMSGITVILFPNKLYQFNDQKISQEELFSTVNLFQSHINYIDMEIVPIKPQLIPWGSFAYYQSQVGFVIMPNSYTNNTYELVNLKEISVI